MSGAILSSVTLPNNQTWQFQYNTYGELTKITYPTGGYSRYDYAAFPGYVSNPDTGFAADFREITARYVCRAATGSCASEDVTTYSPSIDATKTNNQYMDVVSALGDRTRHQFSFLTSTDPYSNFYSTREVLLYRYQGQNTLLRTVQTDYNGLDIHGKTTNASLPIRDTTTLNDVTPNLITKTEWDYGTVADNISQKREYAYGVGAVGPLARRTDYTWLAVNPVNGQDYTSGSIHILNREASQVIRDSGGTIVAQTQYECDNYTSDSNHAPLQASGAIQHNSAFGTSYTARGNVTAVQRWRNTDSVWFTAYSQFDDAGNRLQSKDPAGHSTTFGYADSWGNAACTPVGGSGKAYVTSVTDALGHASTSTFNSCTGTRTSATNQNGKVTSFLYDLMDRLTQTSFPDGGQTSVSYNDVLPISATTTAKITSSMNIVSTTIGDGLGRTVESQLTSDPQGTTFTDINYDALGRTNQSYNPTRCSPPTGTCSEPTWGITTTQYDALNRVKKLIPPDGTTSTNNVTTSYSGNCTTVTDQAGKARESCSDSIGRLTQVFEDPGSSPHLNYETDYTYDPLGNLLTVNQKGNDPNSANWRTRIFTYNSLSQLLTANNPESGTITYTYDSNGNLATKVAPAPNQTGTTTVTTTLSYDALNRLTQKSYSDGTTPTVKYGFDAIAPPGCTLPTLTINNGIGKRTGMCDAVGAEAWSYDISAGTGWKTTDARTTNSVTKTSVLQVNLDGSEASLLYPGGRTITYTQSGAGRPLSAVDTANGVNYATASLYAPTGALSSFTNGSSIVSTLYYNNRLQPCRVSVKATGTAPSTCADTATGNILDFTYNFVDVSAHNNGNLAAITNNRFASARSQSFTYDTINRLATAKTTSTTGANCWDEAMGYDPWGNLLTIGRIGGYTCSNEELLNLTATSKNQVSGMSYDAAGNLLSDGVHSYTYDAEDRILTAAGVTYTYDGDGRRMKKSSGLLYWYGAGSDPLNETDLAGATSNAAFKEYIFFGGKRIARRDSTNSVSYYFADHLGTARVVANSSGAVLDDSDFYPFGGERIVTSSTGNTYKFTGKERDSESGLDNFGARYDSSNMGRFMSPDPNQAAGFDHLDDPQSWNGYAYVRNNPLNLTDQDGENYTICDANGNNCAHLNQKQYDEYLSSIKGTNTTVDSTGLIQVQNANGSLITVGQETYYDEKNADAAAHIAGGQLLINEFVKQVAIGVALGEVGRVIGWGLEAAAASKNAGPAVKVVINWAHKLTEIRPGHLPPPGTQQEIQGAVEGAVQSGQYTTSSNGVISGTTKIQGVEVGFRGKMVGDEMRISTVFTKR
jgi:RHS repeat-associated protein